MLMPEWAAMKLVQVSHDTEENCWTQAKLELCIIKTEEDKDKTKPISSASAVISSVRSSYQKGQAPTCQVCEWISEAGLSPHHTLGMPYNQDESLLGYSSSWAKRTMARETTKKYINLKGIKTYNTP